MRVGGACLALVAATAWVADRSKLVPNPLQGIEDAAVDNPVAIAAVLALIAAAAVRVERRATAADATSEPAALDQEHAPSASV